jgi:hypothetical protein
LRSRPSFGRSPLNPKSPVQNQNFRGKALYLASLQTCRPRSLRAKQRGHPTHCTTMDFAKLCCRPSIGRSPSNPKLPVQNQNCRGKALYLARLQTCLPRSLRGKQGGHSTHSAMMDFAKSRCRPSIGRSPSIPKLPVQNQNRQGKALYLACLQTCRPRSLRGKQGGRPTYSAAMDFAKLRCRPSIGRSPSNPKSPVQNQNCRGKALYLASLQTCRPRSLRG